MIRWLAFSSLAVFWACSGASSVADGGGTGGGNNGSGGGGGTGCPSISCYVASETLCDDYTGPTATQCADVPTSCSNRGGTSAKPAACPTAEFKAGCVLAGGYVLRYYRTRGDSSDQSFCTSTMMGTWSTSF